MSNIDWDGNLVHSNFNKPKCTKKQPPNKLAKSQTAMQFFDSDDDDTSKVLAEEPSFKLNKSE